MPNNMTIATWLSGPGKEACSDAKEWLSMFPAGATMSEAWEKCERADWMFWAGRRSPVANNNPRWRQAAFAIVRRTFVAPGRTNWDVMPKAAQLCVETAERFERGEATAEERSAAESAARSAAWSAALSAAWSAARSAADSAARSAAESAARSQQADILREFVQNPWEVL